VHAHALEMLYSASDMVGLVLVGSAHPVSAVDAMDVEEDLVCDQKEVDGTICVHF
jgi:hypothetical protein